jgi:hypothetical protein
LYKDENGKSLFEINRNQQGRGIEKRKYNKLKYSVEGILSNRHPGFPIQVLKTISVCQIFQEMMMGNLKMKMVKF